MCAGLIAMKKRLPWVFDLLYINPNTWTIGGWSAIQKASNLWPILSVLPVKE